MNGIKTFVDNLANRINQPHYLEIELRKVFNAGIKYAQQNDGWISTKELLPEMITNKDHSLNVLARVEELDGTQVMCLCIVEGENEQLGYCWANAYGELNGDAEFDGPYTVTHWRHIPKWVHPDFPDEE